MRKVRTVRTPRAIIIAAVHLLLYSLVAPNAVAQGIDLTGTWTGASIAGGASYPNIFVLVQNGKTIAGTGLPTEFSSARGTITGLLNGNILTMHSEYPSINYSSDATAVTDGLTMSGTFLDSQGTSGTFSASKSIGNLAPTTTLTSPPSVMVTKRTAMVVMQKFISVVPRTLLRTAPKSTFVVRAAGLKILYDVTVKSGREIRRKSSTRNIVTFRNLPAGKFTTTYKVSAVQKGKILYTTRKSPSATFNIVK